MYATAASTQKTAVVDRCFVPLALLLLKYNDSHLGHLGRGVRHISLKRRHGAVGTDGTKRLCGLTQKKRGKARSSTQADKQRGRAEGRERGGETNLNIYLFCQVRWQKIKTKREIIDLTWVDEACTIRGRSR